MRGELSGGKRPHLTAPPSVLAGKEDMGGREGDRRRERGRVGEAICFITLPLGNSLLNKEYNIIKRKTN